MIQIDFEVTRLLTQLGLLASWSGLHDEARRILDGAGAWSPETAQIRNCQGLALFAAGRYDEAVQWLTQTVEQFPDDDMAKATLAFVLKQLDRPGWSLLAESVDRAMRNDEAVELARHTMGLEAQPPGGVPFQGVGLAGGLL